MLSPLEAVLKSCSTRIGLKSRSTTLKYAQLDDLSARIAGALQRQSRDRFAPVALMMKHDAPLVVAIIGVLRSGGFYFVPNLAAPSIRLRQMLSEVRPWAVIADAEHAPLAREANGAQAKVFLFDDLLNAPPSFSPCPVNDDAPCAIFYTSGSSQKARPLVYTHGGTAQNAMNHSHSLGITAEDRLTLLSPCSAAASVSSIFAALRNGASLFPFQPIVRGLPEMRDWIKTEAVTVYHSVPSLFRRFAETLMADEVLPSIRVVKLGGESVFVSDVDLFRRHFRSDAILINGLGLTEANGNVCHFHVEQDTKIMTATVPVGKPLPGVEVKLLGAGGDKVATNETGEIALRGRFVAPGFWSGNEVRAHSLDSDGWFRTRDLARRNSDGLFEHLGRLDDQLKMRGQWISIAEIEAALTQIPGVREAAVVTRERADEEKEIVAFVSSNNGARPERELRSELKQTLPDWSLPHHIFDLPELPSLANGKIDRVRLANQAVEQSRTSKCHSAPPDALRLQLVRIWEKVLGSGHIDMARDFFALGGDSLAAATMLAAVEKFFGVHLPVSALVEAPTIDQLASLIRTGGWSEAKLRLVALQLCGTKPSLYCVPGAGSDALAFRELVRRLGDDQPCFAFQPQGLDGSTPFLRSIEEIAAAHIASLRQHQPRGPYYLCGSSLGGVVAFEMAQRLTEDGDEVRFLALLDSYGGEYPKLRPNLSTKQKLTLAIQGLLPVAERNKVTLRNLRKGIVDWSQRQVVNLDLHFHFRRRPIPYRRRFIYLQEICFAARRRYQLRPFAGKIDLFRIAQQPSAELFEQDPFLGWNGMAELGIGVHDVPGFHGQHLREPNVAILAQKLTACLAECSRGRGCVR